MATPLSSRDTLARMQKGLRMVTVPFPHLSGLVAAARVNIDARVPTVGVFASGRMVANPAFVAKLKDNELVFVLAHEMLHLALRTHDRARGSDRVQFNYAHDYIINDMLRAELGFQQIRAGYARRARKIRRTNRIGNAQKRRADAEQDTGVRWRSNDRQAPVSARRRPAE